MMKGLSRRGLLAGLGAAAMWPTPGLAQGAAFPPAISARNAASVLVTTNLPGRVGYVRMAPGVTQPLDAGDADLPVAPASTLKAVTALYALAHLGPGHRFRTRIVRAGDMLTLAGGGDPVLSTDDLDRLAADLVATGATTPTRFGVWGGALPYMAEIAPAQQDHLAYNPALSGMILNFNRVHLDWREGGAQMSLQARAARHSPRAYTVTAVPAAQTSLFSYRAGEDRENWSVARSALRRAGSRWLPVRLPELYAGDVFQTLCRARGLVLPAPTVVQNLPDGPEVAGLDSPPLVDILRDMLEYSTNLTAEVVGLQASGARDLRASAAAMQAWLMEQGHGQGFVLHDHSGLCADSRVTARGMAAMLSGPGLASGLPDLLHHQTWDSDSHQIGTAAKTGTLNFVSNLAGYLTAVDGRVSCFTILCSDPERHLAARGQELPAGVMVWTRDAKRLQHAILTNWGAV